MSEEMEIIKVETLPEPSLELLNKVYAASKKTSDRLPKGKYKCCGSGFAFGTKVMDNTEELREYILENGEFKDIETGEFIEREIPVIEEPQAPVEEEPQEEQIEEKPQEEPVEEADQEKRFEQVPVMETIKFLTINDKEFFIKEKDETVYIKSGEDYKTLTVPTEEEIKALNIKVKYKKINYFWSPIVDDEGE